MSVLLIQSFQSLLDVRVLIVRELGTKLSQTEINAKGKQSAYSVMHAAWGDGGSIDCAISGAHYLNMTSTTKGDFSFGIMHV